MNPIYTTAADIKDRRAFLKEMYYCAIEKCIDAFIVHLAKVTPARDDDWLFIDMIRGAFDFCLQEGYDWKALNDEVHSCFAYEWNERMENKP